MTAANLSRRKLLFASSVLGLTLLFRRRRSRAATPAAPPRYLLSIVASGGLDNTMMFDARPLAMTAAGKIHNPLGADPTPWVGANGQTALAASSASALFPLRDRFSVVNGVVMSTSFDGHDQNTNLLLAGNPFGGPSLLADASGSGAAPLDYVRLGDVPGAALDDSRTIPLGEAGLAQLVGGVGALDALAPSLDDFLHSESAALGDPATRFGAGATAFDDATAGSRDLRQRIRAIQLGSETDPLDQQLAVVREIFRLDIARGALLEIDGADLFFDNHAAQNAKAQGPSFVTLCERLARVFQYLAATPYDSSHALIDVTTVVVGTEFGRTMRQLGRPIDDTGTDHNPLSNSILVGGAGIKGGLVLGASDFQTADETLSGAHLALDPDAVKVMGRPFDFAAGAPRADQPATFAAGDYLQIASIVNTLYSLFGVDKSKWRLVERGGAVAPVLSQLLA
jgi:uncharacterized protein (DUF1501 family)